MSDPICGPLIHNFVDETYEDKVDYENSVYFKNFETGVGIYLEKENIFSRRKGGKRREKEENNWRRKLHLLRRRRRTEM